MPRSAHKSPIEPRWFIAIIRVKKQTRAERQIGQGKQVYSVGARQVGAVLHYELAAKKSAR